MHIINTFNRIIIFMIAINNFVSDIGANLTQILQQQQRERERERERERDTTSISKRMKAV